MKLWTRSFPPVEPVEESGVREIPIKHGTFGVPVHSRSEAPDNVIYEDADQNPGVRLLIKTTFPGDTNPTEISLLLADGSIHFGRTPTKGRADAMSKMMGTIKEMVVVANARFPGMSFNISGTSPSRSRMFRRIAKSQGFDVDEDGFFTVSSSQQLQIAETTQTVTEPVTKTEALDLISNRIQERSKAVVEDSSKSPQEIAKGLRDLRSKLLTEKSRLFGFRGEEFVLKDSPELDKLQDSLDAIDQSFLDLKESSGDQTKKG